MFVSDDDDVGSAPGVTTETDKGVETAEEESEEDEGDEKNDDDKPQTSPKPRPLMIDHVTDPTEGRQTVTDFALAKTEVTGDRQ